MKSTRTVILIFAVMFILLTANASALDYTATLKIKQVTTPSGGEQTWTPEITKILNRTETWNIFGTSIYYNDIDTSQMMLFIDVSGTGVTKYSQTLTETNPLNKVCLVGNCLSDVTNASSDSVELKLISLTPIIINTTTAVTTNSGNLVDVYIKCQSGKEMSLDKDPSSPNTFSPSVCSEDTGWSNSVPEDLALFISRNYDGINPLIEVTTEGKLKDKNGLVIDARTKQYVMESNTKYTFKISGEATNSGFKETITETYEIIVSGISGTAPATTQVITTVVDDNTPYTVIDPGAFTMTIPTPGTFTSTSTITATANGNGQHTLTFANLGAGQQLTFTPTDNQISPKTYYFNVVDKATITGNQAQGSDGEGTSVWGWAIGILALGIISVGVYKWKTQGKAKNDVELRADKD